MDNSYKLATLSNQNEIIQDISKYENELKSKMKQDVVLIAYIKENSK